MEPILTRLQALDRHRKVQIATVLTVGIMVAIIVIWLLYFNNILAPNQVSADNSQTDTHEFSFWQSLKRSTASVIDKFTGAKQYNVKPN